MTINAFPLQWPTGWKRTAADQRRGALFGKARKRIDSDKFIPARQLTMNDAIERVLAELVGKMIVDRQEVVISTNVRTRLDGLPRNGEPAPSDPGCAVYWRDAFNSTPRVMAIDQYNRVEDNLAAVAATLEAMRAIERHGGAAILERAFTGFTALPAPSAERNWWDVLQVPRQSTREAIKAAYRTLASLYHPDKPVTGSHEKMAALNAAQDEALAERAQ